MYSYVIVQRSLVQFYPFYMPLEIWYYKTRQAISFNKASNDSFVLYAEHSQSHHE